MSDQIKNDNESKWKLSINYINGCFIFDFKNLVNTDDKL